MKNELSKNASLIYGMIAAGGAISVPALVERTKLSQPSVSRAIKELGGVIDLLSIRDGRSIRYAIARAVKNLPVSIPLYRIDAHGVCSEVGGLVTISGGGYLFNPKEALPRMYESLPWFLQDMRPQGYLGRALCYAKHDELGLGERLLDWSDDDSLYAMAQYGDDLPGDLIVGDVARRSWVSGLSRDRQSGFDYDALAEMAMSASTPGSSAGGEHQKFLVNGDKSLIVKFSPKLGAALAERWRDLLIAEHVASDILRGAGIDAPITRIVDTGSRCYLESERYDRRGGHGRVGVASFMSIDNEFIGRQRSWVDSAQALLSLKMIDGNCLEVIQVVHTFGRLMGNTDMHFGNLSFYCDALTGVPRLELAPIYDMLPMMYAPEKSDIVERSFSAPDIAAMSEDVRVRAVSMAMDYWDALALSDVSGEFMDIAARHLEVLREGFEVVSQPSPK